MVGHGDGGHPQLDCPIYEGIDAARAIQEAVLGVDVEMGEDRHQGPRFRV
jgi:hypothetical protein